MLLWSEVVVGEWRAMATRKAPCGRYVNRARVRAWRTHATMRHADSAADPDYARRQQACWESFGIHKRLP